MSTRKATRLDLLVKVARLYHVSGMRQKEIASQLNFSQSRVSRMLTEAREKGIVHTTVTTPEGSHAELEEEIASAYGLADVLVAEPDGTDGPSVVKAIGAAGGVYLEAALSGEEWLGISSWSTTILAAVDAMSPTVGCTTDKVIQLIGGLGDPQVQVQANHLASRLADLTKASVRYLSVPGLVSGAQARDILLADRSTAEVVKLWEGLTHALVGIGSVQHPSALLVSSGNSLDADELAMLTEAGAVGDICMRFFDIDGNQVVTEVDERVVGIDAGRLRAVPRVIGFAGGAEKRDAILGAVRGGWLDVLITDRETAQFLVDNKPDSEPGTT